MGLFVGSTPVNAVYVGSTPVTAVYVGAEKIWPTGPMVVQITLGSGGQARDQFRAALTARGLDYRTVTEVPFEIELVGAGSTLDMFSGCSALVSAPDLDTSQVTNMGYMFSGCSALVSAPDLDTSSVTSMGGMFYGCSSLASVPDMDTSQVTYTGYMFYGCSALTDGNVRLIGRHPDVDTTDMITGSGLTREPFYKADGTPDDGITIEVHEVTLTEVTGSGTVHPLLTVTVPAGETWSVRIQGTVTQAPTSSANRPFFRIGTTDSGQYAQGAAVDFSGTVAAANSTIAMVTGAVFSGGRSSFTGTVSIEK